jgi:wyosine [tRNA(Phe)-imidazoG37] synthetase (radical SAM superfamily)
LILSSQPASVCVAFRPHFMYLAEWINSSLVKSTRNFKAEAAMLLNLKEGILYGPVQSRRYGPSLGINLMPNRSKLCSFNCVYCHFGLTRRCTREVERFASELPSADAVVKAVDTALQSSVPFNLVTFSGNGEPTLHPQFPEMAEAIVELRNKRRPQVKVALLSNSTGLHREEVRRVLPKIDLPVLKLDAGRESTFYAISRPARDIEFSQVIENLKRCGNFILQTVLVDGSVSNVVPSELEAYFAQVAAIKPREVHLYSIDRPVPETHLLRVPPSQLQEIAAEGTLVTDVPMKAFTA